MGQIPKPNLTAYLLWFRKVNFNSICCEPLSE